MRSLYYLNFSINLNCVTKGFGVFGFVDVVEVKEEQTRAICKGEQAG
jgi:hypothetical protein